MNKGLIINEDVWDMIDDLEPEEKADLLVALSAYYRGEEVPELERIVRMVYKRIALDNARFDPENRQRISDIRAEAGRKGGSKPKQTEANEANGSKISKSAQEKIREEERRIEESREDERREARFTPPTKEEVRDYVREAGLQMDPDAFFDHFKSNGWKVGGKAAMKDWRATARNWARREKTFRPENKKDERRIDYDAAIRDLYIREVSGG